MGHLIRVIHYLCFIRSPPSLLSGIAHVVVFQGKAGEDGKPGSPGKTVTLHPIFIP